MGEHVSINLHGVFRVTAPSGRDLTPKGPKARALLAVLALSDDYRATRVWLRSLLWESRGDEQAAGSLRQMLCSLKKEFGPSHPLIGTDRYTIWLEPAAFTCTRAPAEDPHTLLQGFDIRGEAFEDWLRGIRNPSAQRAQEDPLTIPPNGHQPQPISCEEATWTAPRATPHLEPEQGVPRHGIARPWGVVAPIYTVPGDHMALAQGLFLTDTLVAALRAFDFVDILDQRGTHGDQLSNRSGILQQAPQFSLQTRVLRHGNGARLTITIAAPESGHVLWTYSAHMLGVCLDNEFADSMVARTVTALHDVLAQRPSSSRPCLLAAVHQFFSLSMDGFHEACRSFADLAAYAPAAHAWAAYGLTVSQAERLSRADPTLRALISEHCRLAIEGDRFNPLINALVGHVSMLVFRRADEASHFHAIAAQSGPPVPLAMTLRALFENYRGNHQQALAISTQSQRLAPSSPYQFLSDTPQFLASVLTGNYRAALSIGHRMLLQRPNYLAVKRHMVACLALLGRIDDCRRMACAVSKIDAQFTVDGIMDPSYPLPAPESIVLLTRAFEAMKGARPH